MLPQQANERNGKEELLSMKMVILEVAGKYAAALSDDGTISRIPNQNYRVGQTLTSPSRKQKYRLPVYIKQLTAVAAVFVLLLAGAGVLFKMPVTFVSLDVNPSVEYKLNVFDQVVEVVTINEDAEFLLRDATLVNQPAVKAIKQTVELLGKNNYLKAEQKNDIVISASSTVTKKSKTVLNTVTQATKEATASIAVKADIIAYESSMDDLKQAEKLDTTPGKMLLVNQIVETDVQSLALTDEKANEVQTYLQMPVTDLVSVISEDGLAQLSQNNESVSIIQTDLKDTVSDAAVSDAPSDAEAQTDSSEEAVSAVEQSDTTSDVPSTSDIPVIVPGITTSQTEDTSSSSEQENAPPSDTSESEESFSSEEIPDVKPGINPEETSDVSSDTQSENSPDVTTSEQEDSTVSIVVKDIFDTTSFTSEETSSSEIIIKTEDTDSSVNETSSAPVDFDSENIEP